MAWPSGTNIALGLIVLALAVAQRAVVVDPLASFWLLLLSGITVATGALWSILYRPDMATSASRR